MQIERDPELELSRRLRLDRVPPAGVTLDIEAGATERAALVRRFAVLDIPELKAQVNLIAESGGLWQVSGRLQATAVQACGITLDPVEQRIDEVFTLHFAPPVEAVDDDTGELIVGADAPEPLDGDALDLGEIVADQFGLALDPFPRKPGAQLADILPPAEPSATNGPFAPLAALRRPGKDGV